MKEVVAQRVRYVVSALRLGRWEELGGRTPARGARWERLDDAMLLALKHKGGTAPLIIERVTFDQVHARIDRGGINGVGTLVERGARVLVATLTPTEDGCAIMVDPDERFALVRATRSKPVRPK